MALTSTAIEPVLPEQKMAPLEDMACQVIETSARLSGKVRSPLHGDLVEITRWMHCYYSNLIEGQQTRVRDIEAALRRDFSGEPKKRNMQQLAIAHLEVQGWARQYQGSPFASEFLCELHRRFYAHLPPEMRVATTRNGEERALEPGALRNSDVEVGTHVGPPHELVAKLLGHFQHRYEAADISRVRKIVAVAASHHRLAWIHPFRDGNGRVIRLFSDALIRCLGIDGGGLWSLSRGLMFHRKEYYDRLSNADQERNSRSADDGRGHLSERSLWEFCEFILRTMLDQIAFMDRSLELDTLAGRIERYVRVEADFGKDAERIFLLLREAVYRGQFSRGEAGRITGTTERPARTLLSKALGAGLLKSESHKAEVRLALPSNVLASYFPRLFPLGPENNEADMVTTGV